MADVVNSNYNLDLSSAIRQARELRETLNEANQSLLNASKASSNAFANPAKSTAQFNEELRKTVQAASQSAQAQKAFTSEVERAANAQAKFQNDVKGYEDLKKEIDELTAKIKKLNEEKNKPQPAPKNNTSGIINDLINREKLLTEARNRSNNPVAIERFNVKLRETQAQLKKLKGDTEDVGKATNNLGGIAGRVSGIFKGIAGGVIGGIAGVFAVDKILDIGKQIFDVTARFQTFNAVLTNTLGSSDKAAEALEMIKEIAATTPFSVEQLTSSFVRLTNAGLQPSREEIIKLGDLAASQGKSFEQLAEAQIDAVTGEFERLKEFGIRASKEGDKVTFTFKEQKTVVDNTASAIQDYIVSLGDITGVAGGMEAQSRTLGGQISNLGDAFDGLFLAIGNGSSGVLSTFISLLSGAVTGITNLISGTDASIKSAQNQQASFNNLEKSLNPLLAKYEDLKSKSKLSDDQQKELKDTITQIGKTVPTAITQFDEYGNALDISTGKAKDFIRQQQLLTEHMNADAIEDQTSAMQKLDAEIVKIQRDLQRGAVDIQTGFGVVVPAKLAGNEIAALQDRLNTLQKQKYDANLVLQGLKGITVESEKASDSIEKVNYTQAGLIAGLEETIKKLQEQQKAAISMVDFTNAKGETIKGVQTLGKEIERAQKQLNSLLGKEEKKSGEERKKALEDLNKELVDLEKKANEARIAGLDQNSREYLNAMLDRSTKEIDLIEKTIIEKEKLAGKDGQLNEEQVQQLYALRSQALREYFNGISKLEKEEEQKLFDLRADSNEKEIEALERRYQEEITLAKNNAEIIKALEVAKARDIAAIRLRQAEEAIQFEQDLATARIEAERPDNDATARERLDFERDQQAAILRVQIESAQKNAAALIGYEGEQYDLRRAELQAFINDANDQLKKLGNEDFSIAKALGLTDEEFATIAATFNQLKTSVNDLFASQIEASQQAIDQHDKEIEKRKENLETQLQLNKQGFASDVEGERERIRVIERERAQAVARQRQIQRAQMIADTITQASSLITASANIFKVTSPILPPLGQILAIGAITAMVAAFASAKAKAFSATSGGPSFRTGGGFDLEGKQLKGASHENKGIHLIDSGSGKKLAEYEGNEYLFAINKQMTAKYLPLLEAINAGKIAPITAKTREIAESFRNEPIYLNRNISKKVVEQRNQVLSIEKSMDLSKVEKDLKDMKILLAKIVRTNQSIDKKTLGELIQSTPDGYIIKRHNYTHRVRLTGLQMAS